MRISFQMLYNAKADILLPFVLHDGGLGDEVQHYFRECFAFIETKDGHVDHESVHECLQYIER